ncbi:MAG: tRNA (cytidine(34)-2'-O)-methyltransferase [Pseudobdellovibrionaceae bacterium]
MNKTKVQPFFSVVLHEPEIPQNTGNVGRTCVATNSSLHLIEPFGFEITDSNLKRAGLDYWVHLDWHRHQNFEAWLKNAPNQDRIFLFSTKATRLYTDVLYQPGDALVFGKETKGLPPEILQKFSKQLVKIPQIGPVRSLNLATSVAIASYELIRQLGVDQGCRTD